MSPSARRPLISAAALAAAAFAAAAFARPAAAQAKDFTITVPVNVSGLPSNITEMGISCTIMPEDYGDGRNAIAGGVQRFPVSGSYSGTVTISMNALPGKDPALARWYSCTAQFYGTERGVAATFFASGTTTPPVFPLVAGAPFYLGRNDRWTRIPGR
ncbi:MAG TPA: hypothetical protein VMT93_02920 [Gemmatimonadaceae bacterium]|nr:hypothetical protein [Gemmatimonadaceae bacterium]